MAAEGHDELLNVYDAAGEVVGARACGEAKRSGHAVGAVNALVRDGAGRVLLQKRPLDKENGGRWDKSVGGHLVQAADLAATVVLHRIGLQLNLRDVRLAPGGGVRNVLYHVAIYEGRTAVPIDGFRRQAAEIDALSYFSLADSTRCSSRARWRRTWRSCGWPTATACYSSKVRWSAPSSGCRGPSPRST